MNESTGSEYQHLRTMINLTQRHLNALELQQATMGALTPPGISIQIEDVRQTIDKLRSQLASLEEQQERLPSIQLRRENYFFVDREELLGQLKETALSAGMACIYGPPGVGKTALINRLAWLLIEQAPERFPDGVFWSDLETAQSFTGVVQQILADLGVTGPHQELWKTVQRVLASRRGQKCFA